MATPGGPVIEWFAEKLEDGVRPAPHERRFRAARSGMYQRAVFPTTQWPLGFDAKSSQAKRHHDGKARRARISRPGHPNRLTVGAPFFWFASQPMMR